MNKKILFIDIDGTLVDFGISSIPKSAFIALEKAHENGHRLVLCTGRNVFEMDEVLLSLPIDAYIYNSGANAEVNGNPLYEIFYPKQAMKDVVAYGKKHDIGISMICKQATYSDTFTIEVFSKIFLEGMDEHHPEALKMKAVAKAMKPLDAMQEKDYEEVYKFAFYTRDPHICDAFLETLPSYCDGFYSYDEEKHIAEGEAGNRAASKAYGMDRILDYFQVSKEQSMAFGDSLNDREMLQHAAISVAMGNAHPDLKAMADFVTDNVQNDGLYKAFMTLGLITP